MASTTTRLNSIKDAIGGCLKKSRDICCCFRKEADPDKRSRKLSNGELKKTKLQLIRLGGTVCGIEFCYAAETAFVSPILLNLGVPVYLMTLVWCLSPILGFFLGPLLGSLSDNCRLRFGRRRPFIFLYSLGILTGLLLVPRGAWLGFLLGDADSSIQSASEALQASQLLSNTSSTYSPDRIPISARPWGTALTIIGVMLLDFCCDCCQSPTRSYLLDVTASEEHQEGLSTFTIMAGLGGAIGYVMGGVDWESAGIVSLGGIDEPLGGNVFLFVFFVYLICLTATVTAFKEIPLEKIVDGEKSPLLKDTLDDETKRETPEIDAGLSQTEMMTMDSGIKNAGYGTVEVMDGEAAPETEATPVDSEPASGATEEARGDASSSSSPSPSPPESPIPEFTLKTYILSIFNLPRSLFLLCLTNLFCWMSLVSYSLYFTDFVGQSVFGGDPNAPPLSDTREAYESGVRTGSFAMALYSISCSIYSSRLESLIERFGAQRLYVGGQLVYATGALLMALLPYKPTIFLLSPTAGIMYGTLFTMPYIILANYHSLQVFDEGGSSKPPRKRGLGTDVALLSSMVFVAQFILSGFMGAAVHVTGSTRTVMGVASVCATAGSIAASKVLYLDL